MGVFLLPIGKRPDTGEGYSTDATPDNFSAGSRGHRCSMRKEEQVDKIPAKWGIVWCRSRGAANLSYYYLIGKISLYGHTH
jgi:hypothetical protein